jgi:transcriptional repressor NF-X1
VTFCPTPIVANASVEIYRSNRAALPRNTLSEATKLKNPYAVSAGAYASSGLTQLRKHHSGIAYNAIFLEGVKGSTLQTDLQTALNPILRPSKLMFSLNVSPSRLRTNQRWINDGKDVLLSPGPTSLPIEDVENALHSVVRHVKQFVSTSDVALTAELCWINREGQVSYRESTRQQQKKGGESSSSAVWNKFGPPKVETSNVYNVLTGGGKIDEDLSSDRVAKKEKKKQEEGKVLLLDDWETFEE